MTKKRAKVRKVSVPPKPPETGNGCWPWLLQEAVRAALAVVARHWLG